MNRRRLSDGTLPTERERQRFRREKRALRTPAEVQRDRLRRNPDGLVPCHQCNRRLAPSAFTPWLQSPDGVQRYCRDCEIVK